RRHTRFSRDWSSDVCSSDLIDSMPIPIDQTERTLVKLQVEEQALKREEDRASQARLEEVRKEIAALTAKRDRMKAQWLKEKELISEIQEEQRRIEELRTEQELAQRRGDLGKAAEIRYGRLPECEKKLGSLRTELARLQEKGSFLKEEV